MSLFNKSHSIRLRTYDSCLDQVMKLTVQITEPTSQTKPQMSPLLNHVLPSRVLYALAIPQTRRKHGLCKIQTWLIASLIITCGVMLWLSFNTHSSFRNVPTPVASPHSVATASELLKMPHRPSLGDLYGVVFDAGSTGSRVHVFKLSRNKSDPDGAYVLTDEVFKHIQPGLSSFADTPDKAAESLDPLISAALERIPTGHCSNTSIVLRATAGLRLLSSNKADNILSAVRQKLSSTCFLQSPTAVSILDGNLEGLYLWISLNFMTNRIRSPAGTTSSNPGALVRTVGTLDLGGGSTQITFAPKNVATLIEAPDGYATDLASGRTVSKSEVRHGQHVYSQSYLGLGLMSARYSMLHTLTKRLPAQLRLTGDLFSSCLPSDAQIDWSHGERVRKIRYVPMNESQFALLPFELAEASASLQLNPSSPLLTNCYAHALQVLRDPVEGDRSASIYPPSGFVVHRPEEISYQDFYAFSYVFDLATSCGLINSQSGQQVSISQFRDAADRICRHPDSKRPFECMDLCFITALLHDGYGFPWSKVITLQKKVESFEISWGLGALFAELAASHRS